MLELSGAVSANAGSALPMSFSYGGDTLNSAIYMARLGVVVDYVTALGDDNLSSWMVAQWQKEGVGCGLVARVPGAVPGLYLIENDPSGERSFHYWRDQAPAKYVVDDKDKASNLLASIRDHKYLCLSGITLAIYSEAARNNLFALIDRFREGGGQLVFDGNYRPTLWQDKTTAQAAYKAIYQRTDIALPTFEDEQMLFDDVSSNEVIARLKSYKIPEFVLKMGEQGCLVVAGKICDLVPARPVKVVDTTSAGDSFNAGYLASRLTGESASVAAANGHRLASVVIQHKGAIIPAEAMP